jgi:hypothetical protein
MFSMPILDVAIGLSFFYLLLGLICSTINEMIAGWRKTRARFLDKGIDRLLGGDDGLKRLFYQHPLIRALAASDAEICPSYIPARKFATALLDLVSGTGKPLTDVAAVREGLKSLGNESFRTSLQALLDSAQGDAAALQKNIEQWFDEVMDRTTGWYKRNAQRNAVLLACAITLVVNADTIGVAQMLWTNPTTRAAMVESARARAASEPPADTLPLVEYEDANDATASKPVNVPSSPEEALSPKEKELLGQLTGWTPDWARVRSAGSFGGGALALLGVIYDHGIGWILTALAVSMGAPFWFDTLNRFMNIRNAGRAPDEQRDKNTAARPAGAGDKERS